MRRTRTVSSAAYWMGVAAILLLAARGATDLITMFTTR